MPFEKLRTRDLIGVRPLCRAGPLEQETKLMSRTVTWIVTARRALYLGGHGELATMGKLEYLFKKYISIHGWTLNIHVFEFWKEIHTLVRFVTLLTQLAFSPCRTFSLWLCLCLLIARKLQAP